MKIGLYSERFLFLQSTTRVTFSEINAFAKDGQSFMTYDTRFKESLNDIVVDDQITRWSGPSLRTEVDGLIV